MKVVALDVDLQIIDNKLSVKGIVRAVDGKCLDAAGLPLTYCDSAAGHLSRQETLSRCNAVLYIDHGHVSVSSLTEVDLYVC